MSVIKVVRKCGHEEALQEDEKFYLNETGILHPSQFDCRECAEAELAEYMAQYESDYID